MAKASARAQWIDIAKLRIDGGTQLRETMDSDHVRRLVEALESGADLPPVVVFLDSQGNHWLSDGYHRRIAHIEAGRSKIPAEIRPGSQRDAIQYSLAANDAQGLPRSRADKRKAVETALKDLEWSKWTDHQIAKLCCVSQAFVFQLRKELDDQVMADTLDVPSKGEVKFAHSAHTHVPRPHFAPPRNPDPFSSQGASRFFDRRTHEPQEKSERAAKTDDSAPAPAPYPGSIPQPPSSRIDVGINPDLIDDSPSGGESTDSFDPQLFWIHWSRTRRHLRRRARRIEAMSGQFDESDENNADMIDELWTDAALLDWAVQALDYHYRRR